MKTRWCSEAKYKSFRGQGPPSEGQIGFDEKRR